MKRVIEGSLVVNLSRKIIAGTTLMGVLAMADPGAAQAQDLSSDWQTMKPLYAVSFHVGRKHVLSYFLSRNGQCDLTLMVTDRTDQAPEGDDIPTLSTAQFKAEIIGGESATFGFDTAKGKTLEFACAKNSQAMSVREVYPVMVTSPRPLYPYRFNHTTLAAAGLGG